MSDQKLQAKEKKIWGWFAANIECGIYWVKRKNWGAKQMNRILDSQVAVDHGFSQSFPVILPDPISFISNLKKTH